MPEVEGVHESIFKSLQVYMYEKKLETAVRLNALYYLSYQKHGLQPLHQGSPGGIVEFRLKAYS